MNVGKRITTLRTAKGYSVNKLANLSGISQSYLRDVELGNKNPTVETLSLICDTLGISLRDFFDDELDSRLSADSIEAKISLLSQRQKQAVVELVEAILETN